MENRAHALAAGLFIIGLLVAIAIAGNRLAGKPEERRAYRVIALQPVSGLNPQGQVRFRGLSVGRVSAIDFDPADTRRMLVDIEVEKRVPLTRGTYAQLGMEGITGIAYVHLLDDGRDRTPLPADGVPEIPLRQSMLDELFDSAGGVATGSKEVLASVQKLLTAENRENVTAALASLKAVTANLEVVTRRLPETLERADRFLSEQNHRNLTQSLASVQGATRELPELMKELPELAREAKAMVLEARRLAESANTLALEARGTTTELRHETLPRANALAESVERGAERIGRLAYELERRPESVLWGRPPSRPGPGEAGFE